MGLSSENKLYYVKHLLNNHVEPFHKLLIRNYDEFYKHEYNHNQFSKADEIKKFKELLDKEIITEEEFNLFKMDLLNYFSY